MHVAKPKNQVAEFYPRLVGADKRRVTKENGSVNYRFASLEYAVWSK